LAELDRRIESAEATISGVEAEIGAFECADLGAALKGLG
jgi:hypothetical protein